MRMQPSSKRLMRGSSSLHVLMFHLFNSHRGSLAALRTIKVRLHRPPLHTRHENVSLITTHLPASAATSTLWAAPLSGVGHPAQRGPVLKG